MQLITHSIGPDTRLDVQFQLKRSKRGDPKRYHTLGRTTLPDDVTLRYHLCPEVWVRLLGPRDISVAIRHIGLQYIWRGLPSVGLLFPDVWMDPVWPTPLLDAGSHIEGIIRLREDLDLSSRSGYISLFLEHAKEPQ